MHTNYSTITDLATCTLNRNFELTCGSASVMGWEQGAEPRLSPRDEAGRTSAGTSSSSLWPTAYDRGRAGTWVGTSSPRPTAAT
jgi:hypothetical protein